MRKYVDISGFNPNQPNRGNAALSYGSISFLEEKGLLSTSNELIFFQYFRNPFKAKYLLKKTFIYNISGKKYKYNVIPVFILEKWICIHLPIFAPFTRYGRMIHRTAYEAADYGGDGFSDIYGDNLFNARLNQSKPFMKMGIPIIMLPQTIGPFSKAKNLKQAIEVMRYAKDIYVRDENFIPKLEKLGIPYHRSKDLSAFMFPEKFNISIKEKSVGINVSGLAYSNKFKDLANQFDVYPELIDKLIKHFQEKGCNVYLIPHSYNYENPEKNNDDMVACKVAFDKLSNKQNVIFIDDNLSAPQVKYVISQMTFFIGTRMHANFAAIYTNVPLFGLAYSYKFKGAFDANGLNGEKQTVMINNISKNDIDIIIKKIDNVYNELHK